MLSVELEYCVPETPFLTALQIKIWKGKKILNRKIVTFHFVALGESTQCGKGSFILKILVFFPPKIYWNIEVEGTETTQFCKNFTFNLCIHNMLLLTFS